MNIYMNIYIKMKRQTRERADSNYSDGDLSYHIPVGINIEQAQLRHTWLRLLACFRLPVPLEPMRVFQSVEEA